VVLFAYKITFVCSKYFPHHYIFTYLEILRKMILLCRTAFLGGTVQCFVQIFLYGYFIPRILSFRFFIKVVDVCIIYTNLSLCATLYAYVYVENVLYGLQINCKFNPSFFVWLITK